MRRENDQPDDPLNLGDVDRQIRINEMEERLKEMGMSSSGVSEDCPPGAHEEFLQDVIEYETAPISCHFEQLVKAGVELPAPELLDDGALHAKLWEVINALAALDVALSRTDHLSDRQLYDHLWHDSLREEGPMMPPGSGWTCHLDILGGCSDEDIQTSLRYYDSEEERQRWAKEWPDDPMPPHVDPPFDRDRLLPKAKSEMERVDGSDEDELDDELGEEEFGSDDSGEFDSPPF